MIAKVFVLLCLAAVALSECPAAKKRKADKCAEKMFFVSDAAFSPQKTITQHDSWCKEEDTQIACVDKYGKDCLKGFTLQTLKTALHGVKKAHKNTCKKDTDKEIFMKNTAWLAKDKHKKLKSCIENAIYNMEYIAKNITQNDQIPQSCCNYWLARKCMTAKLNDLAPDQPTRDYLEKYFDDAMTSLINFLCSKQNSISTCQKLMPAAMTRMESHFGNPESKITGSSFLITFLEVVVDI